MVALSWSFMTIIKRNRTLIAWSFMSYSPFPYNFSRRITQKYIYGIIGYQFKSYFYHLSAKYTEESLITKEVKCLFSPCTCISSTLNDYRIWHYKCCRKKKEFQLSCHAGYRKQPGMYKNSLRFPKSVLRTKFSLMCRLICKLQKKNEQIEN